MSRKLLSLFCACSAVLSLNSYAMEYSVFPIVDAFVYENIRATSESVIHASMNDVMNASYHFDLVDLEFNGSVLISEVDSKHEVINEIAVNSESE